jgi:hypothetical protein
MEDPQTQEIVDTQEIKSQEIASEEESEKNESFEIRFELIYKVLFYISLYELAKIIKFKPRKRFSETFKLQCERT